MSFIPCVTLANLTTPVTTISSGGGGSGTYPANGQFSSIVVNAQPGFAGLAIEENSNGYAGIYFNDATSANALYQLQTQPTSNPAVRTLFLNPNPTASDGAFHGNSALTTLDFASANLNISSINGATPGTSGGGAVDSVSATAFNSIVASPNTGAVQLSLGALVGAFPITTLGVVNLSSTASVDIVQLGTSFSLASFAPGWYSIIIPQMSVCVAQFPVGTPNASAVYPGASIQYQIVCGQTGGQTSTSAIHNYILVPANNTLLYAQTTPTTLVGMFYNPAALGSCNTLKLTAFYNPPDASGVVAVGYVSHSSPTPTSPGNQIIITPLRSA